MNSESEGNTTTLSYNAATAAALRAERAASGITFEEIVAKTGMTKSTVIRTFKGDRTITADDLFILGPILGKTPTELLAQAETRWAESRTNS
jgi:transcriptional regulator with XRE-family HTH domain